MIMMKKKFAAILIVIISFAVITPITTTVKADGYGTACADLYTTNWLQWEGNAAHTAYAFDYIYMFLYDQYGEDVHLYDHLWDHGYSTTEDMVIGQIADANDNHDFAVVQYHGHGGPIGFYGYTDSPFDYDPVPADEGFLTYYTNISAVANSRNMEKFVFMWVCYSANDSPYGAPMAWNPQWWSNPSGMYTFIGFIDASPWLRDSINANNYFSNWLVFFYYYATQPGPYSIKDALDAASYATEETNFGNSLLGIGSEDWTYFPYDLPPSYNTSGWWGGRMNVAGDPLGTYLPIGGY
jgi:hypothetical protein